MVRWAAANDADGYEVSIAGVVTNVDANCNSVSIVNKKFKAGKQYDVMVRAWHMNGDVKTYGESSIEKNVKISKRYMAKTKKKVKAYKRASTGYIKKGKLKKGAKVKVLKVKGKWAKTDKGWIEKKKLKALKIVNKATVLSTPQNPISQSASSDSASSLTAAQIG